MTRVGSQRHSKKKDQNNRGKPRKSKMANEHGQIKEMSIRDNQ
jgi:hypothetical protein